MGQKNLTVAGLRIGGMLRCNAAKKMEIIQLVKGSARSVENTSSERGAPWSSVY